MRYAEFERRANDRVEELLEAYADARLDPTRQVLARIRKNVMADATTIAAPDRPADSPRLAPARSRLGWLQAGLPRRALALGIAGSLTLGTSAAVLAAPPGSPFYNARLVIETALLPTEIDARLARYEEHLVTRLSEAQAAAADGDANALAAALAAYDADVAAALGAMDDDADRLAHLEAMLAKHTTVLQALEDRVPEQASVDKAIENSQKAIQKIKDKAANVGNGGTNSGGGRPSHAPNGPPKAPPDNPGPP